MVLLLQYTLIFASVLILVALGGCFAEHSGVINLGLEGIMIMGALGGALAMRYMSSNSSAFSMLLVVLLVFVADCFLSARVLRRGGDIDLLSLRRLASALRTA